MKEYCSIITLYELTGSHTLSDEKKWKIDDIEYYLERYKISSVTLDKFKFIKHALTTTIKVNIDNVSPTAYSLSPANASKGYNYVIVKNCIYEDDYLTNYLDITHVFYFITHKRFISQECVEYTLKMDTLNTCGYEKLSNPYGYSLSKKTYIMREHEDRFKRINTDPADYYRRVIDFKNEGLNPIKYNTKEDKVYQKGTSNKSWYLIVKNTSPLDPDAVSVPLSNPVKIFACSDEEEELYIPLKMSGFDLNPPQEWRYFSRDILDYINLFLFPINSNPIAIGINAVEYYAVAINDNGSTGYVVNCYSLGNDNDTLILEKSYLCGEVYVTKQSSPFNYAYKKGTSASALTSKAAINALTSVSGTLTQKKVISINSKKYNGDFYIDRTDPQIIKIIKIPYSPLQYESVTPINFTYNDTEHLLEYIPNAGYMESNITLTGAKSPYVDLLISKSSFPLTASRDKVYESKLFSSEFFANKFVYDSFDFEFQLECMENLGMEYTFATITFIVSGTTASKFMFNFGSYNTKITNYNYNKYLTIARNNEIPVYNIAYLNYLKTGYNYDIKSKSLQAKRDAMALGSQIASGVLNIGTNNPVGLAQTAMSISTSVVNAIMGRIQAQNNIDRHLIESANQGANINGSDDVDLMSYYTDENKAKIVKYEVNDFMKNLLFDLFYYTGYIQNKYDVPNVTSRAWFNFIQCDPKFSITNGNITDEILEDLSSKFREGVTFFHRQVISDVNTWDTAQEYENWETSLLS